MSQVQIYLSNFQKRVHNMYHLYFHPIVIRSAISARKIAESCILQFLLPISLTQRIIFDGE